MVLLYSFHLRKAVPLYLPMLINIYNQSATQWHVYQCISFTQDATRVPEQIFSKHMGRCMFMEKMKP